MQYLSKIVCKAKQLTRLRFVDSSELHKPFCNQVNRHKSGNVATKHATVRIGGNLEESFYFHEQRGYTNMRIAKAILNLLNDNVAFIYIKNDDILMSFGPKTFQFCIRMT
jgi:hypothetical protein